ncbi:hypothetical protein [Rhodopirellula sp. MGV]|uniref:hypothetical protein n=1 Tax=Rhodopirellula sp. MGV TaxID=2023130 RepID=UPI000B96DEFA|nr:hypothetical protein [Rhodopirellula sp. MGV]OYP28473.1 hypothetical protein CGZ80_27115 [Rhodopirellula sp. MGV]PNY38649.1 hypothetical protein C2E31_01655 [Rhodopirellula baltica]
MNEENQHTLDCRHVAEIFGKLSKDTNMKTREALDMLKELPTVRQHYNRHVRKLAEENDNVRECGLIRDDIEFLLDTWIVLHLTSTGLGNDELDVLEQVKQIVDRAVDHQFHAAFTDISEFMEGSHLENAYLGFVIALKETGDTWVRHILDPLERFHLQPVRMDVFRPLYRARADGIDREQLLEIVTGVGEWNGKLWKTKVSQPIARMRPTLNEHTLEIAKTADDEIYVLIEFTG